VRARSIRALGERNVRGASSRIRDRLIDDQEWPEVRAEAARALGALCDADSADILAAFAKKLLDPMASPDAQLIATGAVLSLGRLALPNLKEALAPLSAKTAPPPGPPRCRHGPLHPPNLPHPLQRARPPRSRHGARRPPNLPHSCDTLSGQANEAGPGRDWLRR
jgi:hypothetical protein